MPKRYSCDQILQLLKDRQGDRTQSDLADDLGVSQQYLCDVFAGKRDPGTKILEALGMYREWSYYLKREDIG
jgi:predicted transcriptional regulator